MLTDNPSMRPLLVAAGQRAVIEQMLKAMLAQRLVGHNRHGVGQVQAARASIIGMRMQRS